MKSNLKQLEEAILHRPKGNVPLIRGVDKVLLQLIRERMINSGLTWSEAFTEMALDWLKKK